MNNISKLNILVTGACGVTSRSVVRAIKKSKIFKDAKIIGTDVCENPYGLYEGLYSRLYRVPWQKDSSAYHELVESICKKEHIDAAVVIPELEVLYWSENRMPVPTLLPPPFFARRAISKAKVYKSLEKTGLVPDFEIMTREQILAGNLGKFGARQFWLRDFAEGGTSGRGAIHIRHPEEASAWMILNPNIDSFMLSDYLPGRNLAYLLLYHNGVLLKCCCFERMEYFMSKVVISGVSGNTSIGRLLNDQQVLKVSKMAIEKICQETNENMTGLVTVDLRDDFKGVPKITEINLRPVAFVSVFSEIKDANIIEALLLATLGEHNSVKSQEVSFPKNNRLFRDIDGKPVYVPNYVPLDLGSFI